jgi:pilus assembly protein Flp/PilA
MFDCARLATIILVRRFLRGEDGATAIEYAMIASGVALAIAAAIASLGSTVQGLYDGIATAME